MTAVVFDLDGTLVDSAPDLHRAANALMDQLGAGRFDLAEITSFIGNGVPVLVQRIMEARGLATVQHDRLVKAFLRLYEADAVALTRTYPGVADALGVLAAEVRLGICTNKPAAPTREILTALDLIAHFGAITGGDSLPVRKPDPAMLRATMDGLGVATCVFVGDSEVDSETALRAEVPFVLFTEGYRKTGLDAIPHVARFSAFADLPQIIRQITTQDAV